MRINWNHEAVALLIPEWRELVHQSQDEKSQASRTFQRALMRHVIEPVITRFPGELLLFYHEFLTRVPSGAHSFAHGSEMISRTIYWVTVGKILPAGFQVIETAEKENELAGELGKIVLVSLPQYLLPVQWVKTLWPIYPGASSRPAFTLDRPTERRRIGKEESEGEPQMNLSALGEHLFPARAPHQFAWATQIEIVVGDVSVEEWLAEHRSQDAFSKLKALSSEAK